MDRILNILDDVIPDQLRPYRHILVPSTIAVAAYTLWNVTKRRPNAIKPKPGQVAQKVDGDGIKGVKSTAPEYDFVIIGGGTAGCVLASRLTEDPNISVLVLERGTSGVAEILSQLPGGFGKLFHSKHDYHLYTEPQTDAAGRKCYWPRGKLLGGCSSVNAMMYHHCAPSDFDEWARLLGDQEGAEGWRHEELKPYFRKFEKYTPNPLFPSVDASLRGDSGPVEIGYHGFHSKIYDKFVNACDAVGIKRNPDINTAAGTLGATRVLTLIDHKGHRVSSEAAYLTKNVLQRPNLSIATQATVTRIIFDSKKRAIGVEFASTRHGPRYHVRVGKEVIVCAGAVHTPQVLMLSGIGPKAELQANSIPVVQDLPGVGQHLMDHPSFGVHFRTKPGFTLHYLKPANLWHHILGVYMLVRWLITGKGEVTTNVGESAAFIRTLDPKLFPADESYSSLGDPTSGPDAPDIELIQTPLPFKEHGTGILPLGDIFSIGVILLRPESKGKVWLKSADAFDAPLMDPKYLSSRRDVEALIRSTELTLRITKTEPLASIIDTTDVDELLHNSWDAVPRAKIEKEIRETIETLYHPTSSARMAKLEDGGVVDAKLRVYGLPNVRVVDASIFPTIVSGHPTAPILALSEKVADMIKSEVKVGTKA